MGDFEEKSENDFSDKIAYVFVGSTGCGKSSTINLFSGNKKAIVSNEANSCTTEIEAYEHSNDNNIILIDTVGAEDSRKVKDEEIMKNILVELCLKKIKKVYIIWCIRPCDRATSTLQKQAEFINTFKNTEIWKSVIILVKESKLSKEEDDTRGVIECAAKNGYDKENVKIPCLLYSCVDWLSEKQKKEFDDNEYTEKQKQNLGLLTSNEVKLKIEKSLQQLSGPTQIIFQIKKCINCNGIGDER
jgi:GTPase Era involved in 16S rRNA processing